MRLLSRPPPQDDVLLGTQSIPAGLPPGTLLQLMYLKERMVGQPPGRFLEVGCGSGQISNTLLSLGWSGVGIDLDEASVGNARTRNDRFVTGGSYEVRVDNFLSDNELDKVDLVISSMVIEHLDDQQEARYLRRCNDVLLPGGRVILLVPAEQRYWGIEDEIAGHQRRYSRERLLALAAEHNLRVDDISGLNFPVSNLLLPISNQLVKRAETDRLSQSLDERTQASGNRNVNFKTEFPVALRVVLNRHVMRPFHWAQKLLGQRGRSLVLYAEMSRAG